MCDEDECAMFKNINLFQNTVFFLAKYAVCSKTYYVFDSERGVPCQVKEMPEFVLRSNISCKCTCSNEPFDIFKRAL
jgi:hypothetical protein